MKTDCLVVILSVVSLIISIGVLICVNQKDDSFVIKDFQVYATTVLIGIVTLLLGWNIYTAIDIKQEWKENKERIDKITIELDELQKEKFNSRANNNYSSSLFFLQEKDYAGALYSALQCINNMLPDYPTNQKLDNFDRAKNIIYICIEKNKGSEFSYNSSDYNYLTKVVHSITEQNYYCLLDKDLKEVLDKIKFKEYNKQ